MSRLQAWPTVCWGAALVVLAGYIGLVASSMYYIGIGDALIFTTQSRMWVRVWLTLYTSTIATAFALAIGIPVGYALSRFPLPWPSFTSTLIDLPVMVPPAAVGVFLFGLVATWPVRPVCELFGLQFSHDPMGVILVQFAVTLAFCCRLMKASFDGVNPRFEQVSRSLGADLPSTVRRVTLPLAKNGILASAVVVWARAAAEWEGLMLFVGGTMGRTDVLPFSVYLDWNGGLMGEVVTYSLVSVALAVASMAIMREIGGKSYVW